MEQAAPPQAPRAKLGSQGLEVSKLGFGCTGLTGSYNAPLGDELQPGWESQSSHSRAAWGPAAPLPGDQFLEICAQIFS